MVSIHRRRVEALHRHLQPEAQQGTMDALSACCTHVAAAEMASETVQGVPASWPRQAVDTIFEPSQHDAIVAFFKAEGYAVVRDALSAEELSHLDEFRVRTQALNPKREKHKGWWAGEDGNLNWSQPLLDWPELDRYAVRHPSSWRVVGKLMDGEENIRTYQFDFREAVAGTGKGGMKFHHDSVMSHRFTRNPYFPLDAMCTIHYLTDVTEATPSFAVVPRSSRKRSLANMDPSSARLVAVYAPRGSMVLYDNATWHTRLDGSAEPSLTRRTMHTYFARGGWVRTPQGEMRAPTPAQYTDHTRQPGMLRRCNHIDTTRTVGPNLNQTNWHLFPKRLAQHEDPNIRRLFSHWTIAMGEWAATNWSDEYRATMPNAI